MKKESNKARTIQRAESRIGKILQYSLCKKSYEDTLSHLRNLYNKCGIPLRKAILWSKINLIQELKSSKNMPLHEFYDEYLGMLPAEYHPKYSVKKGAIKSFVDSILSENTGLPILIVNFQNGKRHVILFELSVSDQTQMLSQLSILDRVLQLAEENTERSMLENLSNYLPELFEVVDSTRERGIILSILSLLFSSTSLRHHIGIGENVTELFAEKIKTILNEMKRETKKLHVKAESLFAKLIENNEKKIKCETDLLVKKENRLHKQRVQELKFNIEVRKKRTANLKIDSQRKVRQFVKRQMKKWKFIALKQIGKGKGKYHIDRGAEQAVYDAIEENLVAHERRIGLPETGYIEGRITGLQMRRIANNWLKKNGLKLVQSVETVRSWGKSRNKRSIQSKQHRGRNLWARQKPQKKFSAAHVNIHYNRAHIKNYTRLVFGCATRAIFKKHTIRRAMDDKAYLRCGTSEGFSRPMNTPVALPDDKQNKGLPCYDFPDKIGYVAPGVTLMINDMEETKDCNGRDTFSAKNVTVGVTCKPKYMYNSTSTNWANDMYYFRLKFPEEHEEELERTSDITRDSLTCCVFLHDSLVQFRLMNEREDYIRCTERGEFLQRELLRLTVLIKRSLWVMMQIQSENTLQDTNRKLLDLLEVCQKLHNILERRNVQRKLCDRLFKEVATNVEIVLSSLKEIVPRHRAIDIQTTDAGPGVGTSEKLVKIRLAEMFWINDLDLQARFHYAPRDSKTHIVERVMSRLNDAVSDGSYITIDKESLVEKLGHEEVTSSDKKTLRLQQEDINRAAALKCASEVSNMYEGVPCMGSTICSHVPDLMDPTQEFFFDESYMRKCSQASSERKLSSLPGSAYFKKMQMFLETHYKIYNNGIEGIRIDREFRSTTDVKRVPPPIPFLTENNDLHYKHPKDMLPSEMDVSVRKKDDKNPIVQLRNLVEQCGVPKVEHNKHENGEATVIDKNHVWENITKKLPDFIQRTVGRDLSSEVKKEAEALYMQTVRKFMSKSERESGNIHESHLHLLLTGPTKMVIKDESIPQPIPWGGTSVKENITLVNTCPIDNMLYFMHILLSLRSDIREELGGYTNDWASVLLRVHSLFKQKEYARGKICWLRQFPQFSEKDTSWNCYESEQDLFFDKIVNLMSTTYTRSCSECSTIIKFCKYVCLKWADGIDMQESINTWYRNEQDNIPCTKQKTGGEICNGTITTSEKRPVIQSPPFVFFEVDTCPLKILPMTLILHDNTYSLFSITYGNGHHFIGKVYIMKKGWFRYDGLSVRDGRGLLHVLSQCPPENFRRNICTYIRL